MAQQGLPSSLDIALTEAERSSFGLPAELQSQFRQQEQRAEQRKQANQQPIEMPAIPVNATSGKVSAGAGKVPYMEHFTAASQRYGVPVNVLMGLAQQESSFNPTALGTQTKWGRAKGLMQYLDSTAAGMGINPYDPAQSIDAAAKQLKQRLDKGYTMIDAVREHFAGPNKKQWGDKTRVYGIEVMQRAQRFGNVTPTSSASQQPQAHTQQQAPQTAAKPVANDRFRSLSASDLEKIKAAQMNGDDQVVLQIGMKPIKIRGVDPIVQKQRQQKIDDAGVLSQFGDALGTGYDNTKRHISNSSWLMTGGNTPTVAEGIYAGYQQQQKDQKNRTSGQQRLDQAIDAVGDGVGFFDTLKRGASAVGVAFQEPRATFLGAAQSAASMLPTIAGGLAGAGAGGATGAGAGAIAGAPAGGVGAIPGAIAGGTAGAIWGSRIGMVAGTTATEAGAELEHMVFERLKKEKKSVTKESIQALLSDPKFRAEAQKQGTAKGLTLAMVDQLTMGAAGRVLSAPAKAAEKKAIAEIVKDTGVDEKVARSLLAAPAGRAALAKHNPGTLKRAAAATGAFAIELMGEPAGEAISQAVARGEVDWSDVTAELIYGGGQAVAGTIAAGGYNAAKSASNGLRSSNISPPTDPAPTEQQPQAQPQEQAANQNPLEDIAPDRKVGAIERAIGSENLDQAINAEIDVVNGQAQPDSIENLINGQNAASGDTTNTAPNAEHWLGAPGAVAQVSPKEDPDSTYTVTVESYENGEVFARDQDGTPVQFSQDDIAQATLVEQPQEQVQPQSEAKLDPVDIPELSTFEQPKQEKLENKAKAEIKAPKIEIKQEQVDIPQADRRLEDMTEAELRDRVKYLARQAKTNGGWDKRLMAERRKVEAEIGKKDRENTPSISDINDGFAKWEGMSPSERMATAEKAGIEAGKVKDLSSTAWGMIDQGSMEKIALSMRTAKPTKAEAPKVEAPKAKETKVDLDSVVPEQNTDTQPINDVAEFQRLLIDAHVNNPPLKARIIQDEVKAGRPRHQVLADVKRILDDYKAGNIQSAVQANSSLVQDPQPQQQEVVDAKQTDVSGDPSAADRKQKSDSVADKPNTEAKDDAIGSDGKPKWFTSKDKAQAFVDKKKLNSSHKINKVSNTRYEIHPTDLKEQADAAANVVDTVVETATVQQEQTLSATKPIRNYSWDRVKMANNLTLEELEQLKQQVEAEHANPRDENGRYLEDGQPSISLYDKKGLKKLDNISWAVYHKTKKVEPEAAAPTEKTQPSANTLVTDDRAAELRARLKAKLSQLNSGIDPEILAIGAELAVYHIERGARKFSAFAKNIAADLDVSIDTVRPYLRSWYNGARDMMEDMGGDIDGMDSADTVRSELAKLNQKDTQPKKVTIIGKTETVTTPAGREFEVRHKVVEASDLVTSNTGNGAINPNYPQALQPRDRSRLASQSQINDISSKLNPRLLGENVNASEGAPIVSSDNIVESGNGRTLAISKAYDRGLANSYREWLESQGYDVANMTAPVLVRERVTPMTMDERVAYTGEANERTTLELSPSERALSDAKKISPTLHLFRGGDIDTSANRDFVRAFIAEVVSPSDRGGILEAGGQLSQVGKRRIQAALLAKAYNNESLISDMFESVDNDIKAIGGALMDVAGEWAAMRDSVENGHISSSVDVTPNLMEAVGIVRRARAEGRAVFELVNQDDIFSGEIDPVTRGFVNIFYRGDSLSRARGRDKVGGALRHYAQQALATTPGQNMFGDPEISGSDILRNANEKLQNQEADKQQDIFSSTPTNDENIGATSGGRQRSSAETEDQATTSGERGLNVPSTDNGLESDRENTNAGESIISETDGNAREADDAGAGRTSENTDGEQGVGQRDQRLSTDGTTTGRESSNQLVHRDDGQFEPSQRTARDTERSGSSSDSITGQTTNQERTSNVIADAPTSGTSELDQRLKAQKKADGTPTKWGDKASIDAALPLLLPEQRGDVLKAETRLAEHNGILFTNGTGTGKTATGLGVAKRFINDGKNNIAIVVPSDKIASDWVKFAKMLGIDLKQLDGVEDNGGSGPIITTYANFGQNDTLAQRDWDLIIPDESHYLSSNEAGDGTAALNQLRGLTGHHSGFYEWVRRRYPSKWNKYRKAAEAKEAIDSKSPKFAQLEAKELQLRTEWSAFEAIERKKWDERWGTQKSIPKVVMLSATPFAYVKNTDYAEGYLFHYVEPSDLERSRGEGRGYNSGSPRSQFMMQHFGYRMRTNKLTAPEAGVNSQLLEQQFNENLKKTGALSGRKLEVPFDYDRKFVLVDDAVGTKIDNALKYLREQSLAADAKARDSNGEQSAIAEAELWKTLSTSVDKLFDYQSRMYLLESIKAKAAVPIIQQHLNLGRKVVVFHDYNKGGGFDPFGSAIAAAATPEQRAFNQRIINSRPELFKLDLKRLLSPIETLTMAFPQALQFNGTVSKGQRRANADKFNTDGTRDNIIVVQSDAGREGVSLHDTTGKHQRVEINLGMPVKPVAATQIEGRIYRTGQASDAIFRYFTTGTSWEASAFASKIAERASTAENLALGSEARGLKESFIEAYQNADIYEPSENDGVGGKDYDRQLSASNTVSPFDKAKTFYWAQQKNTKRRDQREGADYFATPEPVGFKMVEWANIGTGEKALEPSAGHGAIARFFPDHSDVTMIEPSYDLSQRAGLANGNARIINDTFETLHINNKYDAIVMNPPYGNGGKVSTDHLARAATHLRDGGRIVALIPRGGMADKRLQQFLMSEEAADLYTVAKIDMPSSTFERAGTAVNTQVLVLEKHKNKADAKDIQQRNIDLSGAANVNELFDRLETLEIPDRKPTSTPEPKVEIIEHETSYGRKVRGTILTGMIKSDAQQIDPSTFRMKNEDGKQGWFIREDFFGWLPDDYKFSRSQTTSTGATVADVREALVSRFGENVVSKLEQDGVLTILDTYSEVGIEGFTQGGKVTLIADALTNESIIPTFLHELGGHVGMQGTMKPQAYKNLMDQFNKLVDAKDPIALKAKRLAERESDTEAQNYEYLPYLITVASREQNQRPGIKTLISRIVSAVKAWAVDKLGVNINLNANDILALAERMVGVIGNRSANSNAQFSRADQVNSPEFKKWFGDSKVVDENGDPQVRYHGTRDTWTEWDKDRAGGLIHTTDDSNIADNYAQGAGGGRKRSDPVYQDNDGNIFELDGGEYVNRKDGTRLTARDIQEMMDYGDINPVYPDARVQAIYVRAENPLNLNSKDGLKALAGIDADTRFGRGVVDQAKDRYFDWNSTKHEFKNKHWAGDLVPKLKALGYDAIAFSDDGHQTLSVFDSEQIKSATDNVGTFDPSNPDIRFSRADNDLGPVSDDEYRSKLRQWWDEKKQLPSDQLTNAMKNGGMSLVPLRPMLSEIAKDIPAAQIYLRIKDKMDAMRNEWHGKTDAVAQNWLKYRIKNREENRGLMEIMHESTLMQVDPSKPFEPFMTPREITSLQNMAADHPNRKALEDKADRDDQREKAHAKLKERFDAMSPEAKSIFDQVKDAYSEMADAFDEVLLKNMEKAINVRVKKAEREHAREMERIRDEGLQGEDKTKATDAADRALKNAKTKISWNRKARLTQLRQQFETQRLQGPYFPLARFGDLFVTVRDKETGEVLSFSRFDNATDQRRFAEEMRANKDQKVEVGALSDAAATRKAVDPNFVADVEDILADLPNAEQVKDEVWQRYLESLPDMSSRKARIHRKGRAGYNADAVRAFGHQLFHSSHQLARMAHSMDLEDALDQAKDDARHTKDPVRSGLIVNEMEKRHQFVMSPTGGQLATWASSFAFVWYLAGSPKAAIMNLFQTPIMGVPILGAYAGGINGVGRATRQLSRALVDFTHGKGFAARSSRLNDEERAAMELGYETGIIEKTQGHELAGVAETGVEYNAVREKVMKTISWGFHHTERLNREVTFLAGYRLARQKGETQDQAVSTAADLVWKSHFDYSNTSRPRLMHTDTMKILLVFRNFQVNMLFRLFRDTHQAFNGDTKEARKEAFTHLAGITGMMMLNAGITGTWLFGIAMIMAGLFMEDGEDPEEELKKGVVSVLGPNLAGLALYGAPGHTTGTALSESIGMPDLWFRSPDSEKEGEEALNFWVSQLLGAVPAIAATWARGLTQIGKGEEYRGIETMMPKMLKDPMKSYRYATDGAKNMKGDTVAEVEWSDVVKQALGFTPARISEQYKINNLNYNKQQLVLSQRKKLMDAYYEANKKNDAEAVEEVLKGIDKHNDKNPDQPITAKGIMQSIKTREKGSQSAVGGIRYNSKLRERILEEQVPSIYK